ncbi:GNAT family N-acetyltransferase [Roseateles violae]|uniref:GNAT family N-acetyltransferase n=1 Tax=Roseateles violae TaxID=3058042 RepID=A0ABT8DNH3_9BURK|nr:GNAT family N-acetyltransferase [Pelomonas sp. PFR6]MDN3919914.1 GNAT family N-acetyltransferase [Pelomonas sp. PFR6]
MDETSTRERGADCVIEPLGEAGLPAYKALRDRMLAGHPEAFTSDAETERLRAADSYRGRLGGDGAALFSLGAWLGSQLVGAITVEREPRVKVRHIAHIVGMMVDDAVQGRGIGARLLDAALERLRREEPELEMVVLSVTRGNGAALRLYASRGFERYGRLPGAIKLPDGSRLDKDLMNLRLRP